MKNKIKECMKALTVYEHNLLGRAFVNRVITESENLCELIESISRVACGEDQIECDGSYDDSDGMKWVYDKTKAFRERTL